MAGEWSDKTLGELTEWASGGTPPKSSPEFWGGGIPWISASSMKTGRLNDSDRTLTEAGLEKGSHLAKAGSVLLLVRGSELHKRIPVGIAVRDVAFNQDVKALVPRHGLDRTFLYYWLTGHEPLLLGKVEHTGIGAGKLDTQILKELKLQLPDLSEQRAISHILGTLDDKIELNRRRNQTLEAMARALFKDWFVDFGPVRAKMESCEPYLPADLWQLFPDRLDGESKPEGWRSATLGNFASLNPESWTKKNPPHEIRYVDLSNAKQGTIEEAARMPYSEAPSRAQRVLRIGDTIVGTVRPGNESFALISKEGMTGSTGFAVLRPQEKYFRDFVFLAATSPENIERLSHLADGAAYPAVRPDVVLASPVTVPSGRIVNDLLRSFANAVNGWVDAIEHNKQESRTLAKLRNTLLPKLISGELRIAEAERFMARAEAFDHMEVTAT